MILSTNKKKGRKFTMLSNFMRANRSRSSSPTRVMVQERLVVQPVQERLSVQALIAGRNILENFMAGKRYGVMHAQMQSGKTMTYHLSGAESVRFGLVDNVVIFSGNSEKDLRDQTIAARKKFQIPYFNYLLEMGVPIDARMLNIINGDHITVVWGSQLEKFQGETSNTLFIWDESHVAQNIEMRPAAFLAKIGASGDGNSSFLEERNNYFLSVSATPFSEVSNIFHDNQDKFVTRLEAGEGYHSIETMFNIGCIIGFDDWRVCLEENFAVTREEKKYALVRLNSGRNSVRDLAEAKAIAVRHGWLIKFYDSDHPKEKLGYMKHAPLENTVIFLKGKCRMGQVLIKDHIDFCLEAAQGSKTDTVAQALAGRICGYHDFTNIRVFLHNKILQSGEIERYIRWARGEDIMPRRANNLINNGVKVDKDSQYPHHIIPVKIEKNQFEIDGSEDVKPARVNQQFIKESVASAILDNRCISFNTEEQMEELQDQMRELRNPDSLFNFVVRIIQRNGEEVLPRAYRDAPEKLFKSFTEKQAGGLGSSNGIREKGEEVVIWWFADSFPGIQKGDVFVDAKTQSSPIIEEIMKTTRKEVFCRSREVQVQEDVQELQEDVQEVQVQEVAPGTASSATEIDILECREIEIAKLEAELEAKLELIRRGTNDSKYNKKWLKDNKCHIQLDAPVKKERVVKKRRSPHEVLQEGDVVFLKSHRESMGIWRNGNFVDGDNEFPTLNKLCVYHHTQLNKTSPNAWTSYGVRRQTGEIVLDLDSIFLV